MRNLYLSRHGETDSNIGKESETPDKLNKTGREQAQRLGIALKLRLHPEEIIWVTSTMERSVQTATIAAAAMGIELDEDNHFAIYELHEKAPIDWLVARMDLPRNVEYLETYFNEKAVEVLGRYEYLEQRLAWIDGVMFWNADLANYMSQGIAEETEFELTHISNTSGRPVVAILHRDRNLSLLRAHGCDPEGYEDDYCGLFPFDVDGTKLIPGSYVPHKWL